jgi:hypothetical protein
MAPRDSRTSVAPDPVRDLDPLSTTAGWRQRTSGYRANNGALQFRLFSGRPSLMCLPGQRLSNKSPIHPRRRRRADLLSRQKRTAMPNERSTLEAPLPRVKSLESFGRRKMRGLQTWRKSQFFHTKAQHIQRSLIPLDVLVAKRYQAGIQANQVDKPQSRRQRLARPTALLDADIRRLQQVVRIIILLRDFDTSHAVLQVFEVAAAEPVHVLHLFVLDGEWVVFVLFGEEKSGDGKTHNHREAGSHEDDDDDCAV